MKRILFFDDFPFDSENRLFRMLLRKKFQGKDIEIIEEKTVQRFEKRLKKEKFDIVILDIMAEYPGKLVWTGLNDVEVPSTLTGLELLRRCRHGVYADHYADIPIYIRTARGEIHIQYLCDREGATGYYKVGAEDFLLIDKICNDLA